MAALDKKTKQQILLAVLMVGLLAIVIKQYMPELKLPTQTRIDEQMRMLHSRKSDLAVQQKMNDDWRQQLGELQAKTSTLWTRKRPNMPVEQEVAEEFKEITRLASVNLQRTSSKLQKNLSANYVQTVEVELQMTNSSMQEFSRLLREVNNHRRKLYWTSCKIDPDNQQKPNGIRVNARLQAYVLNDDATRILANGMVPSAAPSGKNAARKTPASRPTIMRNNSAATTRNNSAATMRNNSATTTRQSPRKTGVSPTIGGQ